MNILCKLGIHKWKYFQTWIPSIRAEFVTDFINRKNCLRCNKEIILDHFKFEKIDQNDTPTRTKVRCI